MASWGKITNKRSQEHPKPYERPKKSLLGRVGETMRDILTPSFLKIKPYTKSVPATQKEWNSSLDYSESTMPQQIEVEMDGYVATFDSSIIGEDTSCAKLPNNGTTVGAILPAASQNSESLTDRLTSSHCDNDMHVNAAHSSAKKSQAVPRSSYSYTQSLMGNTVRQPRDKNLLHKNGSTDDDVNASESEPKSKRYRLDTMNGQSAGPSPLRPSFSSTVDTCPESNSQSKRNSLWSTPLTAARLNRPAFNITTFCTSNDQTRNDLSVLSRSYQESPFYRGRTTYGGAAASNKQSTIAGSPYHMVSSVAFQRVKVKPAGLLDGKSGIMSSTARRIYEAIERTSPIEERTARGIPSVNVSSFDSPLSFNVSVYRRNSLQTSSVNSSDAKKGPPVKDLTTPTVNLIAQSRSVFAVSTQVVSHGTDSTHLTSNRESRNLGGGGKMKRDHSKHYSINRDQAGDDSLNYTLPSHVSLLPLSSTTTISLVPLTNTFSTVSAAPTVASISSNCLPQTSIWGSARSDSVSVSVVHGSLMSSSVVATTGLIFESVASYKFSSPIDITDRPSSNNTRADSTYVFSQPLLSRSAVAVNSSSSLKSTDSHSLSSSGSTTSSSSLQITVSSVSTSTIKSPAAQSANNTLSDLKLNMSTAVKKRLADDVVEPSKQLSTTALKQGSVLDFLGSKPSGTEDKRPTVDMPVVQQTASPKSGSAGSSFSDVPTGSEAAILPTDKVNSPFSTSEQPSLSEMFKQRQAPGSWSCNECYVTNKATDSKCVACCTLRPGVSASSTPSSSLAAPTSTVETSAFQFGSNGGFTFKSSDASSSQTTSFKFGATEPAPSSSGSVTSTTTNVGSTLFGKVSTETALTSKPQAPFGGFQFGQPSVTTVSNSVPVCASDSPSRTVQFGAINNEISKAVGSTFSFTGSTGFTAVQTNASKTSGSFNFGMATTTASSISTTSNTSTEVTSNTGLFKFGGSIGSSNNTQLFSASLPVSSNLVASTKSSVQSGAPFAFGGAGIPALASAAVPSQFATSSPATAGSSAATAGRSASALSHNSVFTTSVVPSTNSETSSSLFMFGQQSSVSGVQRPLGVASTPASSVFQFGSAQQPSSQSSVGAYGTPTPLTSTVPKFGSMTSSTGSFGTPVAALGVSSSSLQSQATSVPSFGTSLPAVTGGGFKFAQTSQPSFAFGGLPTSGTFTAGAASTPLFGANSGEPALSTLNGKAPTFGKPETSSLTFASSSAATALPAAFGTSVSSSTGFNFAGSTASPFAFGASTSLGASTNSTSSNSASLFAFGKTAVSATVPAFGQGASPAFGSSAVPSSSFAPSSQSASKASSNGPFGQPSVFGSVNAASQSSGSMGFGGFGQSSLQAGTQQPFGQTGTQQPFGQASSQQPFGQSTFGSSNLPSFGSASQNVFGQSERSNVFAFGAASTPATISSTTFGANSVVTGTSLGKRPGESGGSDYAGTKKSTGFESFGTGQSSGGMFGGASAANVPSFGAPAGGFAFGGQQQPQTAWNSQPSNTNQSSFSIPPSFNFAQQSSQQQPTQQPLFQFGAAEAPAAPGARIIKKATRKLRK